MSSRKTCHILRQKPFPRTLSLVIPLYNEEEVFPLLRSEVTKFMDEFPARVEVVLVNDGSRDRTVELAALWAGSDSRIVVLQLARNFGHQLAATAGLDNASGDAVVLMDADLQDPLLRPVIGEAHRLLAAGMEDRPEQQVVGARITTLFAGAVRAITWSMASASAARAKASSRPPRPGSSTGACAGLSAATFPSIPAISGSFRAKVFTR